MIAEKDHGLSSAYIALIQSDGWKDLEHFMDMEREASMRRIDSKAASELTVGEICEEKGIRKAINKILRYVQDRKNGI